MAQQPIHGGPRGSERGGGIDGRVGNPGREKLINLENPGPWTPAEPKGRAGVPDTARAIDGSAVQAKRVSSGIKDEPTADGSQAWDPERVKHVRYPFSA